MGGGGGLFAVCRCVCVCVGVLNGLSAACKGKTLLLVVLPLLYYNFNFMYSSFYEPAMTTTNLPLLG